jgi:WD40 repeat protein
MYLTEVPSSWKSGLLLMFSILIQSACKETSKVQVLGKHGGVVTSLAGSDDSHRVASGDSRDGLRVWDLVSGNSSVLSTGGGDSAIGIAALAFTPKGGELLSAGQNLTFWNVAAVSVVTRRANLKRAVTRMAVSPTGNVFATGNNDGEIQLWNPASLEALASLAGHKGGITGLAFSPDQTTVASATQEGSTLLWDWKAGRISVTLSTPKPVIAISFSPSGNQILTLDQGKSLRVWDAKSGDQMRVSPTASFSVGAFSSDSALLVLANGQGPVSVESTSDGKKLSSISSVEAPVNAVAFVGNNSVAMGLGDGSVVLWQYSR